MSNRSRKRRSVEPLRPKPVFSSWRAKLQELPRFVERARKNAYWVAATSLILAAGSAQLTLIVGVIPSIINAERKSAQFHQFLDEGDKVSRVYAALQDALSGLGVIVAQYTAILQDHDVRQPIDQRRLARSVRIIDQSKRNIDIALGTIRGTQFDLRELEDYRPGFVEDVTYVQSLATDIEEVFETKMRGDSGATERALISLREDGANHAARQAALYTRLDSFSKEARSLQFGWSIDLTEGILTQKINAIEWALFVVGLIYEAAFVVIVDRALQRSMTSRKRSRVLS